MYEMTWRNKFLTLEVKSIGEMAYILEASAKHLREMKEAGVVLENGAEDDYAHLVTADASVAAKFGMEKVDEEDEFEEGGEG